MAEQSLPDPVAIKHLMSPEFPCIPLGYCPYGWLIEIFPLQGKRIEVWDKLDIRNIAPEPQKDSRPCPFYGHDCPVYYAAEEIPDELKAKLE